MIRLIKESSESFNGSLANSKYAEYLTADQIKEFDNQYKMLASLAKLINDNIEILKEQDTKVPDVFWGAGEGEDEYIYAWLEDAWDQFKDYVDSIGCEIDVRDGRSSPHITFSCDFLNNLRDYIPSPRNLEAGDVDVYDVANAIYDTIYGSYKELYVTPKKFDEYVDWNYDKFDYDSIEDAVQDTFGESNAIAFDTDDYDSTFRDIDRAIQALDYIDSFKNNATDNYRSWYVNNGYGGYADDDFDESVRRKRSMKEYIDNSDTIELLEDIFEKLRYHSKNLNKTQYYLFSIAYDCFQEYRNGNGTKREIFKKCREFAEYCQTHNRNLTNMQDGLVDDILSNT